MFSDLKYSILLPILIAFAISAILGPVIIPWLHKLKFGQYIREDGPKEHQKKSGTPTMGGIIFLLAAEMAKKAGITLPIYEKIAETLRCRFQKQ